MFGTTRLKNLSYGIVNVYFNLRFFLHLHKVQLYTSGKGQSIKVILDVAL